MTSVARPRRQLSIRSVCNTSTHCTVTIILVRCYFHPSPQPLIFYSNLKLVWERKPALNKKCEMINRSTTISNLQRHAQPLDEETCTYHLIKKKRHRNSCDPNQTARGKQILHSICRPIEHIVIPYVYRTRPI